jgi:hypothetical protein
MRRDRLELALHELTSSRSARQAFTADPDAALARYQLDEVACRMVKELDVRSLAKAGVNPMLTWGLWLLYGQGGAPTYLRRLNDAEATA